jgi:serine/threonine protein kinase HipA of HipAB toxin-antitoxin module
MNRLTKRAKPSPQTLAEAEIVAKSTQRPGQTKEQTKLIAQGIQKGIDQYKKQQKSHARELNKQLKRASKKSQDENEAQIEREVVYRQHWLPWVLLALSWAIFVLIFLAGELGYIIPTPGTTIE